MAKKILILNGPNLNLLGSRQPDVYGSLTLDDIKANCLERAKKLDLEIDFRQSNHEGELISWIQQCQPPHFHGLVINPAAYSHTSIGIPDALSAMELPKVEVHISNIFARESFRHHSFVSPVSTGIICGFGPAGYLLALNAIVELI